MKTAINEAVRNMPVHWGSDQERTEYIIANARTFLSRYKTQKTLVTEEWDDLESAKKAARFAAEIGSKIGRIPSGVSVIAFLADGYEAIAETYYSASRKIISESQLNSNSLNSNSGGNP
jgi:hypothetical protein